MFQLPLTSIFVRVLMQYFELEQHTKMKEKTQEVIKKTV
jgi:hypothetical protein